MERNSLLSKVAYGALAGVAGTIAIQIARSASQKLAPSTESPMREDPGQRMIHTIERLLPAEIRDKIPKSLEAAGSAFLSVGYGSSGAAIYTALRSDPALALDGAVLGTAIWAAGYVGWLPAIGLMPAVHKQKPSQIAVSVLQHVVYGVATVAAYRKLRQAVAAA